jgi:RHS repeat-associated protein
MHREGGITTLPTAQSTPVTDVHCQYVWDLRYIDSPVLRDEDLDSDGDCTDDEGTGSERLCYANDANFNVTALVETDGAVTERTIYDAYGQPTLYDSTWSNTIAESASKANEIRFCGYVYDAAVGLYTVRYRVYDPALGRWVQRDPAAYVDGMSPYEYVQAAPMIARDSSGLSPGWWVAQEDDVTAGPLRVNDAYDLALWENTAGAYSGHCVLYVQMIVQFQFKDTDGAEWKDNNEKWDWLKDWKQEILDRWNGKFKFRVESGDNCKCPNGISVDFEIETLFEGASVREHWEIKVKKIRRNTHRTSNVQPHLGNVNLDSEDLTPSGAAAHEFGHMLGLPDEYPPNNGNGGPFGKRADRIMIRNSGRVRWQHYQPFLDWINNNVYQPDCGGPCTYEFDV